jgi:hypothetical protein
VDYQHQGQHSLPELDPMLRPPRKSIAAIAGIEAPSAPRESDAAAAVEPEEGHSPGPSQKDHTSPHGPGPDGAGSSGSKGGAATKRKEGEAATKRNVIRPPDGRVK